jgi:histidyl-tRNA synthetase
VRYEVEPRLVRGLDYYTSTVFEISSSRLGAQDAILGGGRYDQLIADLGGPQVPAIGFAIGEDRLIEVLPESFRQSVTQQPPAMVVGVGEVSPLAVARLAEELRAQGVAIETELSGRPLKAALKRAGRLRVRWVLLLGEEELASESVTVKDFESGQQEAVARAALGAELKQRAARSAGP